MLKITAINFKPIQLPLSDFEVVCRYKGEGKLKGGSTIRSLEEVYKTSRQIFFKLNPNEDIYLNVVVTVPKDAAFYSLGLHRLLALSNEKEDYVLDKQALSTGIKIVPKIEVISYPVAKS